MQRITSHVLQIIAAAAGAIAVLGSTPAAAAGCVAAYGATNGYGPNTCSYVATRGGRYAGALDAGGFEISVGPRIVASSWNGAETAGVFHANAGETVTVTVSCDRGVYCAANAATGAMAVGDQ